MTDLSKILKDHPTEYEQGQRARLSGVDESESPYESGDLHEAWKAGFDAAEGEAARNKTSGPVEQQDTHDDDGNVVDDDKPEAAEPVGQTETLADLNKND